MQKTLVQDETQGTASTEVVKSGYAVEEFGVEDSQKQPERRKVRVAARDNEVNLIGTCPLFRRTLDLAVKVAHSDVSVFITGETGTGKEMFARYLHQKSRRAGEPFIAVDCAALPKQLIESEMFGHCKGAFSGAVCDKRGLLEMAHGGTLFLDEVVEMPKASQAKLLPVMRDGIVRRVGSEKFDALVNVRFIAAANGNPEQVAARGDLRADLYSRLRIVHIHLPPLRERPADIPVLAKHLLEQYWQRHREHGATPPAFTAAAEHALASHAWRGNVRELQNVIESIAVLSAPGAQIGSEDLTLLEDTRAEAARKGLPEVPADANADANAAAADEGYHEARERVIAMFETRYLSDLIERAQGKISSAARLGGVDRTTLYRLMDRHGLRRSPAGKIRRIS